MASNPIYILVALRSQSNWVMDMASSPRNVEEIFKDYGARRTAVIRALTHGTTLLFLSSYPLFLHFANYFFALFFSQTLMNFTASVIQVKGW